MINMVPTRDIKVRERIRKGGPKPSAVQEMLESIRSPTGLLQPGLASRQDGGWVLTVGETRFRALERHWLESDEPIKFGTTAIPPHMMPIIDIDTVDPRVLLKAEIDENLIRTDLSWQDRCDALAAYHTLSPDNSTIISTARKLSEATGQSLNSVQTSIARSLIVSDNMDDPDVKKATSLREAWNIVKLKSVAAVRDADQAERVVREAAGDSETGEHPRHHLYNDDCDNFFAEYSGPSFDLVLCDPPYGGNADAWTFKKVTHRHKYDDSLQTAMELYNTISKHGYRLCAARANIFLFCSADLWHIVADIVELNGWTVWPRPLIWVKSNEGMRPWGQAGFGYGYECLCYATKGDKGLINTHMDVMTIYKPRDRIHAAQKPTALYEKLINLSCIPGDHVLDPTCGSGTIFRAATITGTIATGVERDPQMAALASHYTTGRLDKESDGGEDADEDSDVPLDLTAF